MKIVLLFLISFNTFADVESDRVNALKIRFSNLTDIALAMEKCGFTQANKKIMIKDMIVSKDNTIIICLESKQVQVNADISDQNSRDSNYDIANEFIKNYTCSNQTGIIRSLCVRAQGQ